MKPITLGVVAFTVAVTAAGAQNPTPPAQPARPSPAPAPSRTPRPPAAARPPIDRDFDFNFDFDADRMSEEAREMARQDSRYALADQYGNEVNSRAHEVSTGPEILAPNARTSVRRSGETLSAMTTVSG